MKLLHLIVVTSFKSPINPIPNPNLVSGRTYHVTISLLFDPEDDVPPKRLDCPNYAALQP
jgi:hypothetical protein